jgi:creatinine amidohydrolase
MRFEDLNWMDVEDYLARDTRIILITGATAQHAYLSLFTDILIPSKIALAAAEREHVLIAPPLNFGLSTQFSEFPGTISLSQQTFEVVLFEIVQSLFHQGFRDFVILNGHSGNTLPLRVEDLYIDGVARIVWYEWWRGEAAQNFQTRHRLRIDHANWGENFPFNRVAESPNVEKMPVNLSYIDEGQSAREVLGDGSFGGVYQVDDALMNELFNKVVDEVAGILNSLKADV